MAKITSIEKLENKFLYKAVIQEQDIVADLIMRGDNYHTLKFSFEDGEDVYIRKGEGKGMNSGLLIRRRDDYCLGVITNRVTKNFDDIFADMLEAI